MKVIIIGAGNVGLGIGRRLAAEGHDVIIIERDEARVEAVRETLDADVRVGNGASILNLIEAGVRDADLLLAVGDNDESNVIASLVASKLGVRRTIARVRNQEFYVHPDVISSKDDLGVDLMINPELVTSTEIVRLLQHSGASEIVELIPEKVQLVGIVLDNPALEILDHSLSEVGTSEDRARMRVVAISRDESKVIVPTGADRLQQGDHLYLICRTEDMRHILGLFGKFDVEADQVVIFGATQIGIEVARSVSRLKRSVKIYDPDPARVDAAALTLPGVLVSVGDGTEAEILDGEDFGPKSVAIAVGDDEESNILIGLLAKRAGATKSIVLVRRPHYVNLVTAIEIDAAVNPHLVTVGEVMRFLRGGNMMSLTALEGGNAEVMQFLAKRGGSAVGIPLKEVSFPRGTLVGALLKEGRAVIPTGDTVIEDGDQVIAFALAGAAGSLKDFF